LVGLIRAGFAGLLVFLVHSPSPGRGTTIWNGPLFTYNQPNPYPSPDNQDSLTPSVALTRGSTRGLFNAALENGYSHFTSPLNTEWAYGALSNYSSLIYTDWEDLSLAHPPNMVGKDAVLHLISDDIYLSIEFTSWGQMASGFSYVRSTPNIPEPSASAILLAGVGAVFLFGFRRRW
jgi:hypothetical protein